jgi:hypothetical protein
MLSTRLLRAGRVVEQAAVTHSRTMAAAASGGRLRTRQPDSSLKSVSKLAHLVRAEPDGEAAPVEEALEGLRDGVGHDYRHGGGEDGVVEPPGPAGPPGGAQGEVGLASESGVHSWALLLISVHIECGFYMRFLFVSSGRICIYL